MAIADDWTIDYTAKTITHSSGSTIYTVRELYTYLMDEFDELTQGDDDPPLKYDTPTQYQMINGWAFGAEATDIQYLKGGAVTVVDTVNGNDVFANIYSVGTMEAGTLVYIAQGGTVLTGWWSTGQIDVLVKVQNNGTLIASGQLVVFAREDQDRYSFFDVDASDGGRQVAALATEGDKSNLGNGATVTGITIDTAGGYTADIDEDGSDETYDIRVNCAGNTLQDVYDYLQYLTRRGSTTLIGSVEGQQYIRANAAYTPIASAPFGQFLGGVFFGARGILLDGINGADANNIELIAADGLTYSPPESVRITIDKVVAGDKVSVYRLTGAGGSIDKTQFTTTASNPIGAGVVNVTSTIPQDTPKSGTIRLGATGIPYAYTSYSGTQFTLSGTLAEAHNSVSAYVPLVYGVAAGTSLASDAMTYVADIPVKVVVRRYNGAGDSILPFEIESTVGNTNVTVSAIRNEDTVVT